MSKATVSFIMSVRLSARMEQLGTHSRISNKFGIFRKSAEEIQVSLKSARIDFDVLLAVHLSIILVINQLNAQIFVL